MSCVKFYCILLLCEFALAVTADDVALSGGSVDEGSGEEEEATIKGSQSPFVLLRIIFWIFGVPGLFEILLLLLRLISFVWTFLLETGNNGLLNSVPGLLVSVWWNLTNHFNTFRHTQAPVLCDAMHVEWCSELQPYAETLTCHPFSHAFQSVLSLGGRISPEIWMKAAGTISPGWNAFGE